MKEHAIVIAAHGRQYRVELSSGETLLCFPRGKKSELACGDRVTITRTGDQGVIEAIAPRTSLLYRSNAFKQKLIAANVDQLILVAATEPAFSDALLGRGLIAAEHQGISPLIVLNKCDLAEKLPSARERLSPLRGLGYPILELSALDNVAPLLPFLQNKTSVLVGQSGMGKSTLINQLIPEAHVHTQAISTALNSGKHTTTYAQLYHLDASSHLIDSPGLQEFGLRHLDKADLEAAFPDFAMHLGQCRFRDCRHQQEPDCSLRQAIQTGKIAPERMQLFQTLLMELMQ